MPWCNYADYTFLSFSCAGSTLETHGPYQHGSGFPAVNGDSNLDLFTAGTPPSLQAIMPIGVSMPGIFASEFGASVYSGFESMAPTLNPAHWSIHGGEAPDNCTNGGFQRACIGDNPMSQRNYPCDSFIIVYFGKDHNLDAVGAAAFQQQLYQCTVGQALEMKADIENRRSSNEWGTIVWQFNVSLAS
jgi:beta-mannosidase